MVEVGRGWVYNQLNTWIVTHIPAEKCRTVLHGENLREGIFVPTISREKVIQAINRDLKKMDDAELRAISAVSHHIVKDKWRLKFEKGAKEPKEEE